MKNLKKVLALVMAFAMAFTMFAGAVAFEDVELGSDYSAAISMLSDLEVVSGNGKGGYEPAKAVTRAEMCVLIANMMNGGKADTARFAGGSNFSDVAHGWWGESAIAYCVQNGITYGVGGGKFAPNREITDAEAVAMLTRAMGYDTAANPLSFPYGNYTAAVNNGIVDNIPYVEGSACTKGEAAQMIYDCLFADYARMSATLNVIHNSDDHDEDCTLIEDVFGLDRAANAADDECTQHYWVIAGIDCQEEDTIWVRSISDNGKTIGALETMECTADVSALIGYKVVLWGENEHGSLSKAWDVDVVKAVEVVDDQVAYEFNPTMDIEDDLGLDEDDWKADKCKGFDGDIFEKNGNSYVLIDWDNDDDIDYINATERYYGEITSLTSKKVVVAIDGESYTLDLVDGEADKKYCDYGHDDKHDYVVELDAEDGDVVEVTVADTYENTLVISIATVEPETKELTEIDKKGNTYFDDEKMDQAEGSIINDWAAELDKTDLETDFDVWVNANGYIIKLAESTGATEYFMVLAVEDGKDSPVDSKDEKAVVEVMYTDGSVAELAVAFDAENVDEYVADEYFFMEEEYLVGGIFTYELNDDGDLETMELVYSVSDEYSYSDKYDEISYSFSERQQNDKVATGEDNTVEFTAKDFAFVVDDEYVKNDGLGMWKVDTDKVAVLALDEIEDIDDEASVAFAGVYEDDALVLTGDEPFVDQSETPDYADGALMVVEDLAAYLGEKTHAVGAITNVSISKNGVYTFTMDDGSKYTTGKTDKTNTLYEELLADENDSDVIELILADKDGMEEVGYVIYADLTMLDGEVTKVVLLNKLVDDAKYLDRKSDDDFTVGFGSDYRVTRGIVKDVVADAVKLIRGVKASSDKTIEVADEYKDADSQVELELTDDTIVWDVDEIPGLVANVKLTDNFSYHKDADIAANGELNESKFDRASGADILYVADFIYDDTDADYPVYAAYAFEDVEDADYKAKVETKYEISYMALGRSVPGDLVVGIDKVTLTDGVETGRVDFVWAGMDASDVKVAVQRVQTDYENVNDPTGYMPFAIGAIDSVSPSANDFETTKHYVVSCEQDFAANDKVAFSLKIDGVWVDFAVKTL